ncbi:MAG: endonuclease domain-containing protein, partial [Candidatus Brocadiaceae bacterium]
VPRWRGCRGWKRNAGIMREKPKADGTNNYAYNKQLQPSANSLRKKMTKAEASLWKYALRAGHIKCYQFRRQRPVLQYIADFLCKELKLIIEVDGITHLDDETSEKDKRNARALESAGFTIIRFTDEDVLKNMSGVIQRIVWVVDMIGRYSPPPTPPPAGDRFMV